MFCEKCGKEQKAGSRYCSKCGASIESVPAVSGAPVSQPVYPPYSLQPGSAVVRPQASGMNTKAFIITGLVALALGVVVLLGAAGCIAHAEQIKRNSGTGEYSNTLGDMVEYQRFTNLANTGFIAGGIIAVIGLLIIIPAVIINSNQRRARFFSSPGSNLYGQQAQGFSRQCPQCGNWISGDETQCRYCRALF